MFVLTQLKLSEFSKNVLQQVLPVDHPVFSKNFDGEIDFVIIHRRIGVILMEVKSKDKLSNSLQHTARKQVQKGEEIIHALLQADQRTETRIPVYKVIALPNIMITDECRSKSGFIGLREVHVRSDDHFNSWWKSVFDETDFDPEQQQKLQHLIGICVCQKSEVSSAVLESVCKNIVTQNFLQKSYEKGMKNSNNRFQVSKTADSGDQLIFACAKQFLFLNPDQLRIWNGDSHMFFNGSLLAVVKQSCFSSKL